VTITLPWQTSRSTFAAAGTASSKISARDEKVVFDKTTRLARS
jgi:hypothetical protein